MSPPKVNLSGKEPLHNVSDEPLPEKQGPLDIPAVVTVETDRRVQLRRECQRQRARRVICGAAMVIIVAVAALGTMALVHRLRRHHRKYWSCRNRNTNLPEHVNVDHHNQLIRVSHDHDDNTKTNAMEILHEYNRKMVAYKDLDKKVCYIDRLDETFEAGYERWQSYEKDDHKDKKVLRVLSKQPIEVDVIQHVMDVHITEHCRDSRSVWVEEIEEKQVTTQMEIIRV